MWFPSRLGLNSSPSTAQPTATNQPYYLTHEAAFKHTMLVTVGLCWLLVGPQRWASNLKSPQSCAHA